MSFAIAGMGGGAADAVADIMKQRLLQGQLEEQKRQSLVTEHQRQQQLDQQAAFQAEQQRQLAEERAATAQLRKEQAAKAITDELAPGDVIEPQQAQTIRAASLGSLIEHQAPTLPSTQFAQSLIPGQTAPTGGGGVVAPQPGNPEQDVFKGTAGQRRQQAALGQLRTLMSNGGGDQNSIGGRLMLAQVMQNAGLKGSPNDILGPAVGGAVDDQRYQAVQMKKALRQPVTPEDAAFAQAYEKRKTLVPTANFNLNAPKTEDARVSRSYDARSKELESLRKPIADRADKIAELEDELNQGTPQADALVAPKLLSVMVGGQGSGLRMNEAEIARVVGGRSVWESLKASAQKWSTNPETANSITADQRAQIHKLVDAVKARVSSKLSVLDKAGEDLIDAGDVDAHRRILNDARKQLTAESGGGASTGGGVKVLSITPVK